MRSLSLIRAPGLFAAVLLMASCSDDDDRGSGPDSGTSWSHFACTDDEGHFCVEEANPPVPISELRDWCNSQSGVISETCSRSAVSGSCKKDNRTTFYYNLSADELDSVRELCQSTEMGAWTDGG